LNPKHCFINLFDGKMDGQRGYDLLAVVVSLLPYFNMSSLLMPITYP